MISVALRSFSRILLLAALCAIAFAQDAQKPLALPVVSPDLISLQPQIEAERFALRVSGPHGVRVEYEFSGVGAPFIEPYDLDGMPLPNGVYRFELIALPEVSPATRDAMQAARLAGDDRALQAFAADLGAQRVSQYGSFLVQDGALLLPEAATTSEEPATDVDDPTEAVFSESSSIKGSLCVGLDCLDSESYEQDTLRLKENTLRIHVDDTSTTTGYPTNDWRISFNDVLSGGADYVALEDATAGTAPVRVDAGAGNHALYIESGGDVGFGTNSPAAELHAVSGDAPALRLEQDTTGSFAARIWELSADESNFAVTDVTGSATPLLVEAGAPANALFVEDSGDVGFGTATPSSALHLTRGDGSAQLKIEETSATVNSRILVDLVNKGPLRIRFRNTDNNANWCASNDAAGFIMDSNATTGEDLLITNSGRFLIRPNGISDPGLVLENNGNMEIAGTLTENSNRHAKKDFEPVNPQATLDKVTTLPLSKWTYKDDELGTRHFGPMAQDFADLFGLGKDREHIAVLDMAGVALASIQGLQERLAESKAEFRQQLDRKDVKLQEKDAQIHALSAALAEQQARLDALENLVRDRLND